MKSIKVNPEQLLGNLEPAVDELKKHYQGLNVDRKERKIQMKGVSRKELVKAREDLEFYLKNPEFPLNNICSRMDNYTLDTDSQKEALEHVQNFLYSDKNKTEGLFIWGEHNVGKTHLAVALTRELMAQKRETYFLSSQNNKSLIELGPKQVWVLDDLDSPYGSFMNTFYRIVLNAHEKGGKFLVTSRTKYEDLIELAFEYERFIDDNILSKPQDESRVKLDRLKYKKITENMPLDVLYVIGPLKQKQTTPQIVQYK